MVRTCNGLELRDQDSADGLLQASDLYSARYLKSIITIYRNNNECVFILNVQGFGKRSNRLLRNTRSDNSVAQPLRANESKRSASQG